jgi:hypothetical protein
MYQLVGAEMSRRVDFAIAMQGQRVCVCVWGGGTIDRAENNCLKASLFDHSKQIVAY